MSDWSTIKVEKQLCEHIAGKRGYPGKYKIAMPKDGEYAEYHILHSENMCADRPNYCAVMFPEDFVFQLIKTEREQGQRFPRIKLSASEFQKVFAAMNKHLDRKDGDMWLAEVTDYAYRGQIEINREKRYAVGAVEGKWLYLNADDKRRISANGVELIRPLDKKDIEKFKLISQEYQFCLERIESIKEYQNHFFRELRLRSFKGSERIAIAEEHLSDVVSDELAIAESALLKQEERFEKFAQKDKNKENSDNGK